jgi:hypothetical protein
VPSYVDDLRADLRDNGVLLAVNDHDTARLFDWLMSVLSFQGIADRVAQDFIDRGALKNALDWVSRMKGLADDGVLELRPKTTAMLPACSSKAVLADPAIQRRGRQQGCGMSEVQSYTKLRKDLMLRDRSLREKVVSLEEAASFVRRKNQSFWRGLVANLPSWDLLSVAGTGCGPLGAAMNRRCSRCSSL